MSTRPPNPAEDDDVEIEVVPAKPAPARPKRPRTPNPEVDEMIQSGEIVEARSRIVRSSDSQPRLEAQKIEVRDDPTEPTRLPDVAAAPPRRRILWLIAAIAPALAAGALVFVEKATPGPSAGSQTLALQATAEMIGTTFDSDARATLVRVEAIASSSMLRAGIATDAATLADMARSKDVVFPVEKDEVLEVFQVRDGARTSMLRIPATATAILPPASGNTRIESHANGITITAIAPITQQADTKVTGEVVLVVPVDLEPIKTRVSEHAIGASIAGLGAPVVLLTNATAGGTNVTVPIETKLLKGAPLKLTAAVSSPTLARNNVLKAARFACMALAGLLLLVFALSLMRR